MSELHKHLRSMQSTQEFSRLFSMCFLEKPSCSKANKQKNISPPPNPPKKQKKAKKTTRAKNHHPTPSPPTNQGPNDNQPTPTDPNRPNQRPTDPNDFEEWSTPKRASSVATEADPKGSAKATRVELGWFRWCHATTGEGFHAGLELGIGFLYIYIYTENYVVATLTCFIFTPIWRRFPFWVIFFRWVKTTN